MPSMQHVRKHTPVRRGTYQLLPLHHSPPDLNTHAKSSSRTCPPHLARSPAFRWSLIFLVISLTLVIWLLALDPSRVRFPNPYVPEAKRVPETKLFHGLNITDDYSWLRDIDNDPDVTEYIDAENRYASFVLTPMRPLRKTIAGELRKWSKAVQVLPGRDAERSYGPQTPPPTRFFEYGSYLYWMQYPTGKKYPVYFRRSIVDSQPSSCACLGTSTARGTIVLDYNQLIPDSATYFAEGVFEPSPKHPNLIAFSYDLSGAENFRLFVMDLDKGLTSKGIGNTYYSARWGVDADDICLYYNVVDPIWGIPRKIFRSCVMPTDEESVLGTGKLVYIEQDVTKTTEVDSTSDGKYLYIKVVGQVTSETMLIKSSTSVFPQPRALFKRVEEIHYSVEHRQGQFYVLTNAGNAPNYQIIRLDAEAATKLQLTIEEALAGKGGLDVVTVVQHNRAEVIERMEVFETHLIAWVRTGGLRLFRIFSLLKSAKTLPGIRVGESTNVLTSAYSVFPGTISDMESRLHRRFDSPCLVFSNSSFRLPARIWAHDLRNDVTSLLVDQQVTGYDPSAYTEQRIWVPSLVDPTIQIPVSLIRRNDFTGPRPLVLKSYGAYGTYTDPVFSTGILPLLDRGITYAMCHPRGDGNLGPAWYQDGKYALKKNTLDDVGACLHGLIAAGFTARGQIAVFGRSAGGLIAGDVVNRYSWNGENTAHPDAIVKAVVAQVPFVDPVGDMTDETIPWTPFEYYEWGNPIKNVTIFDAMRDYSPYENIPNGKQPDQHAAFPALYVSTGLQDPRVGFWEPIKWVAKLRTSYSSRRQKELVLRVGTGGHFTTDPAEWLSFIMFHLIGDKS
ncbi:prolyl oligopeptidase [Powellomyces hirtus]|nr:prolyl oligopeptidase [Powellomyces hirtus]